MRLKQCQKFNLLVPKDIYYEAFLRYQNEVNQQRNKLEKEIQEKIEEYKNIQNIRNKNWDIEVKTLKYFLPAHYLDKKE